MKTLLLKPFERFSETSLIAVGLIATLIGSYLGHLFKVRFDGAIDLHFSGELLPLEVPFIENGINIGCLTLFLFLAGKLINKRLRLVDVLAVSLVSRIPYYLVTLLNSTNSMSNALNEVLTAAKTETLQSISQASMMMLGVIAIVSIVALVWYVALLWNGFKVASNAKGSKHIFYFIIASVLAEIASKALIYNII